MTSRNRASHQRSTRAFWLIFLVSACILVMLAGVTLAAAAPYVGLATVGAPPTSRPITWGPAHIAKPTYTPSPVPTATSTPLPTETPVPAVMVDTRLPADSSSLSMSLVDTGTDPGQQDAPAPYTGGKSILVSISEQHLWAYDNGQLVYSFIASTGMRNSTRAGSFSVLDKIPNAYGSTWNIWMPNWMGIYYSGTLENGIHALPILPSGATLWAGFLGTPISYGCVVLGSDESLQLYNWSEVGTPVDIQW